MGEIQFEIEKAKRKRYYNHKPSQPKRKIKRVRLSSNDDIFDCLTLFREMANISTVEMFGYGTGVRPNVSPSIANLCKWLGNLGVEEITIKIIKNEDKPTDRTNTSQI